MKRFAFLMGVLSTFLLATPTQAWIQPCPGHFGFQAEYLYLYPCLDDPYFVIDASPGTILASSVAGERIDNSIGFKSGVRLEGAYALCDPCLDARVRWTYLQAREHDLETGRFYPTIGPTLIGFVLPIVGNAESKFNLNYHTLEGLVGKTVLGGCCNPFELVAQVGVQYSYANLSQAITYVAPAGFGDFAILVQEKSKFWGVGPELALDGAYDLFCLNKRCFPGTLSLTGRATATLLVSKMHAHYARQSLDTDVSVLLQDDFIDNDANWRIVPAWHLRLGLNYATRCLSCVATSLEIGYEFTSFSKALSTIVLYGQNSSNRGLSFTDYSDLGLHGPYAALSFVY